MHELALSDNLNQIEYEIRSETERIGKSIWEIGVRLKHVKENDLAHGQFMSWYQSLGFNKNFVSKAITVAENLSNFPTLGNIGTEALYLIATLPDEQKTEQLERIENGDNPTVRELQEVKRQLNQAKADLEEKTAQNERLAELALQKEEPQVIEKEIIKEVVPDDYESSKALAEASKRNEAFYKNQNVELREEMKELEKIIKDKDKQLLSQSELEELRTRKFTYDTLSVFEDSVETFLQGSGALIYSEQFMKALSDRKITLSILENVGRVEKWLSDLKQLLPTEEIIEEQ